MAKIRVVSDDIVHVVTDAIVTLINREGDWYGGVDWAIKNVAGGKYHRQAQAVLDSKGLFDKQVVVAKGNQREHNGFFDNVIFVVDDLKSPLSELVFRALYAAKQEDYHSIALPLFRTGVMAGVVEPDLETVIEQMIKGFKQFVSYGDDELEICVVIYANPLAVKMFRQALKLANL